MEISTTIILLGVFFIVGIWAGWVVRGVHLLLMISKDPDRFAELIKEVKAVNREYELETGKALGGDAATHKVEDLKIESHGGHLYLFTKDKDEFIAQGATLKAALDEAGRRFPNRIFHGMVSREEAEALGISVDN